MTSPQAPNTDPLNLQLWYGDVLVAELEDVFPHQGTWFAQYRQVVVPEDGPLQRRLCELIAFCEEWHQRLVRDEPHDATEFDAFADVLESGLWRIPCLDGTELSMDAGPVFVQGEATWNHDNHHPTRAQAAAEVYFRLTGRWDG